MELGRASAPVTFVFETGSDFRRTFRIRQRATPTATPVDVNLTGSTFTLEIRRIANGSPLESIACDIAGSSILIYVPASVIGDLDSGPTEAEINSRYHGRLIWIDANGRKRRPLTIDILISNGRP